MSDSEVTMKSTKSLNLKVWGNNLQGVLVNQSQRLLLQLRDLLLALLARASSFLLRLGDGHRPGALRRRSAAASRLLRRVEPFPGGHRRPSARTPLHLQHKTETSVNKLACSTSASNQCVKVAVLGETWTPGTARKKKRKRTVAPEGRTYSDQAAVRLLSITNQRV